MRICMLTSEFPPVVGGVSHYVYKLSKTLTERGHKVTIITRGSGRRMLTEHVEGITVYRVPLLRVYPIHIKIHQFFQNLILSHLKNELDVIHIHHPLTPPFHTTLPVVATVHSSLGFGSLESQNFYSASKPPKIIVALIRWYFSQMEHRTIKNANQITVVSRFIANELRSRYGDEPSTRTIEVIGNGIDTKLFIPGTQNQETNILYTGRLAWNKGLIDLVNAAKIILEKHPDVSFTLTGEGPIELDLRRMVRKMAIDDRFSFRGYLTLKQLIDAYQKAAIFLFPTYYEGLPTSLLEAMACRVPAITTPVGGIPEILQNQQNGVLVPTHDPEAIADAVLKLLHDDKTRLRIGEAARKTVLKYYDWNKLVDKLETIYDHAIREKALHET